MSDIYLGSFAFVFSLASDLTIISVLMKQNTCLRIQYVSISYVLATTEKYKGGIAAGCSDCMYLQCNQTFHELSKLMHAMTAQW